MASMYETIMELPLFKGIGEEQLSQMLEKTSIEFLKYEDGDKVTSPDEPVRSIDFILGGKIRNTYRLSKYPIEIDEILGSGTMIGAIRLYGLNTTYGATGTAIGKVNILRIEKSQYMNILQSDKIYLLNFVNYLSAAAQKSMRLVMSQSEATIKRTLIYLADSIASRMAETVVVAANDEELAKYCGVTKEEFCEWKTAELAHNRIILNQRGIILRSPHLLR